MKNFSFPVNKRFNFGASVKQQYATVSIGGKTIAEVEALGPNIYMKWYAGTETKTRPSGQKITVQKTVKTQEFRLLGMMPESQINEIVDAAKALYKSAYEQAFAIEAEREAAQVRRADNMRQVEAETARIAKVILADPTFQVGLDEWALDRRSNGDERGLADGHFFAKTYLRLLGKKQNGYYSESVPIDKFREEFATQLANIVASWNILGHTAPAYAHIPNRYFEKYMNI